VSSARHFSGRIFPGFPSLTYLNAAGEMTAAGQTALDAIRTQYGFTHTFTVGLNHIDVQLVIVHRSTPSRPIPPNTLFDPVSASIAQASLATQRRRGDFGRTNIPPF